MVVVFIPIGFLISVPGADAEDEVPRNSIEKYI